MPLFILPVVTGPILVLTGFILKKYPPRKINWWYGYRTSGSMKNQERWDFSQQVAARALIVFGALYGLTGIFGFFIGSNPALEAWIAIALLLFGMLSMVLRIEHQIKKRFK